MIKVTFLKIYNIIELFLFTFFAILILLFPLVTYKINLKTPIFPALEIILIYHYNHVNKIKSWILMLITLLLDQLNSLPLGLTFLIFLIANFALNQIRKWLSDSNLKAEYLLFSSYMLLIFVLKYLLLILFGKSISFMEFGFQYLTTLFTYPLFKFILDKSSNFVKSNARVKLT